MHYNSYTDTIILNVIIIIIGIIIIFTINHLNCIFSGKGMPYTNSIDEVGILEGDKIVGSSSD